MAISSGDSHPDLSAIVSFEIRETYIPHGKFELANQHLQSPSEFRKFNRGRTIDFAYLQFDRPLLLVL